MKELIYCGQCGEANPVTNSFCGRCGNRLPIDDSAGVPKEYEYKMFEWKLTSRTRQDCVQAREGFAALTDVRGPMSASEARLHFWQRYQQAIHVNLQLWFDQGWQATSEIGSDAIVIELSHEQDEPGLKKLFNLSILTTAYLGPTYRCGVLS